MLRAWLRGWRTPRSPQWRAGRREDRASLLPLGPGRLLPGRARRLLLCGGRSALRGLRLWRYALRKLLAAGLLVPALVDLLRDLSLHEQLGELPALGLALHRHGAAHDSERSARVADKMRLRQGCGRTPLASRRSREETGGDDEEEDQAERAPEQE